MAFLTSGRSLVKLSSHVNIVASILSPSTPPSFIPLLRQFTSNSRSASSAAPSASASSPFLRQYAALPSSSLSFSSFSSAKPRRNGARGFASSSQRAALILPAAVEAPPEEIKDTAVTSAVDATPVFSLTDSANDVIISSGTLDLTSLPGSWGLHPIMRLQSMFLNLHESFPFLGHGLPWYILIPAVTVCLRLLLFGFQVRAQSNAARMAIIQPQMLAGMEKLKAAKARGDFMGAQTAQMETQKLMSDNNVNPIKNLAFPLAQATVFMTMFFALKGLAGAELPTMMTEGLGWVENLTLPDPYWVLPIASTALTLATLELGVDSTTQVQTSTTKNMKLFFRVMLCVALPFIAYFPAALLLYWVTNNSISLLQSLLLKQPFVRAFFNIPTIPRKAQIGEVGYVPEPSFSEAFKNVQIGMSDKWEETKEKGAAEAARQKSFAAVADGGPQERAQIYRPRIPRQQQGAIERVSRSLSEDPLVEVSNGVGGQVEGAKVISVRAAALDQHRAGKAKRAEQSRAKRLKQQQA